MQFQIKGKTLLWNFEDGVHVTPQGIRLITALESVKTFARGAHSHALHYISWEIFLLCKHNRRSMGYSVLGKQSYFPLTPFTTSLWHTGLCHTMGTLSLPAGHLWDTCGARCCFPAAQGGWGTQQRLQATVTPHISAPGGTKSHWVVNIDSAVWLLLSFFHCTMPQEIIRLSSWFLLVEWISDHW